MRKLVTAPKTFEYHVKTWICLQVVDKEGKNVNYQNLSTDDKQVVLTELLIQTALQSIAEKRIVILVVGNQIYQKKSIDQISKIILIKCVILNHLLKSFKTAIYSLRNQWRLPLKQITWPHLPRTQPQTLISARMLTLSEIPETNFIKEK